MIICTDKELRAHLWGRTKHLFTQEYYPGGIYVGHSDPGGDGIYCLPRKCRKKQYDKLVRRKELDLQEECTQRFRDGRMVIA